MRVFELAVPKLLRCIMVLAQIPLRAVLGCVRARGGEKWKAFA